MSSQALQGTVSKMFGNTIIIGKDSLFVNGANVSGVKEFDEVKYTKVGFNLETIEKVSSSAAPAAAQPGEMKTGGGKITIIDLDKPYFEYSYLYQGAPSSSKFFQISDAAKVQLAQYHVGDEIQATWTVFDGNKKLLQGVGPKQNKFGGKGGGKPFDPVADAKRQRMIVRQSCLDRAVTLWINGTPGVPFTQDNRDQLFAMAEDFEKWVMRE